MIAHAPHLYSVLPPQFVYNCISDSLFSNSKVRERVKGEFNGLLFYIFKSTWNMRDPFFCFRCCYCYYYYFHVHHRSFLEQALINIQTSHLPLGSLQISAFEQRHSVGSLHSRWPEPPLYFSPTQLPPPAIHDPVQKANAWCNSSPSAVISPLSALV